MDIVVKRVYEPAAAADGRRLLVDRVWPRGLRKADAHLDAWNRDAAPSSELRRWFGHDPARWDGFRRRYAKELDGRPAVVTELLALAGEGRLTLLYGSREPRFNNAVALKGYLEARDKRR